MALRPADELLTHKELFVRDDADGVALEGKGLIVGEMAVMAAEA